MIFCLFLESWLIEHIKKIIFDYKHMTKYEK